MGEFFLTEILKKKIIFTVLHIKFTKEDSTLTSAGVKDTNFKTLNFSLYVAHLTKIDRFPHFLSKYKPKFQISKKRTFFFTFHCSKKTSVRSVKTKEARIQI